ncbi:hypothetical protein TNIN_122801 [Trichonephila inaurata madagascariensis]|uniref:Uncharacterized protein n=1 Tax=Trichonephila inaurata madagascariensis TaxID=2747483 RepID=A0A8X6XA85_9ARAC|nr:hypothetical protein TNIN_122801 [Trichonephila inaurata madagascariensis]
MYSFGRMTTLQLSLLQLCGRSHLFVLASIVLLDGHFRQDYAFGHRVLTVSEKHQLSPSLASSKTLDHNHISRVWDKVERIF